MKKSIICLVAALGLLASCDPVQSEKDFDALNPSADALADAVTFSQYSKTDSVTPQENGNWIVYNTNPQQIVSIVSVDATGGERVLDYGKTHGAFMLSPSRGSNPEQQIIVRVVNSYGENVDAKKTLTVDVPTELAPELKMLCGENGQKAWKWNVNAPSGRYWGNCGNWGGFDGKNFALNDAGWWGVPDQGAFDTQLNHAGNDDATADISEDATMVFSEDGTVTCYDADGKQFRQGKFSVKDYDPEYKNTTEYCGILEVDAGSILFPYEINSSGNKPTKFEIAYVSPTQLVLLYPDKGVNEDGVWTGTDNKEGTFWKFASSEDLSGVLTDFEEATWTWDNESDKNGCWGNGGYGGLVTGGLASLTGGSWWGVMQVGNDGTHSSVNKQIEDYGYGFTDGEGATMTFKKDGTFVKSSGGKGTFEFNAKNTADLGGWNEGKTWGRLTVSGDGLLFPVRINAGTTVNEYDVVYFDDTHLVLAYPNYPKGSKYTDGSDAASWMEGTYWKFKKVTSTSSSARRR